MPIPQRVVDRYLEQAGESRAWVKDLTVEQVEDLLASMRPRHRFTIPTFRLDQKICFLLGAAYPESMLMTDMGLGKGHPRGTNILTPTGWRAIETLRPGDVVIGSNGKTSPVTGVFDRGKLPIFNVTFNDKTNIHVDGSHLWTFARNNGAWKRQEYSTHDTKLIKHRIDNSHTQYYIPLVKPVAFNTVPLPIPPYILGVLLGDGHLASTSGVTFCPRDSLVPREVEKELPDGLFLSERRNPKKESGTTWGIVARLGRGKSHNPMLDSLRNLQLKEIRSANRFIPDAYKFTSIDNRVALLQGLLDTDGTYSASGEGDVRFCTTSLHLAEDICFLAESLGGIVRRCTYPYNSRGDLRYDYSLNLPPTFCPFRGKYRDIWKPRKTHLPVRIIKSIEPSGEAHVYCIAVDSPDHLYVTEHCIVTHNTGVSLELLTYFRRIGEVSGGNIFVPTNELAGGWEDEILKWGFDIPYVLLTDDDSEKKWARLRDNRDAFVIGTYVGVAAMASRLVPKLDKAGKPTGAKVRGVIPSLLAELAENADAVVFDQSTALGSRDSLSYQVCDAFSRRARVRYSLAGRAFGRDAFVLWSQMFLTDRGEALGTSLGMYREAFWRRERHAWGTTWVPRKRREPQLGIKLAAASVRYTIEECVELPPRTPPIIRTFDLTPEGAAYYDGIAGDLAAARGNFREVKNNFLRMRQISSGFVGFIDDETEERAQLEFDPNPKLDLMLRILEEVPEDRKVVIFHEFTYSGSRICQALAGAGYQHGWLWGGTTDWDGIKRAFRDDPDYRVLVANHRKGAQGLNLQSASYMLFYESPVSAIQRPECERRIYRTGQRWPTFYYDLVMRGGVDEDILEFHHEGADLMRSLVEDPERVARRWQEARNKSK